jgi:hypothetical protein
MSKSSSKVASRLVKLTTEALLVDLANMRDDGITAFRRKWDAYYERYSDDFLLTRRDELLMLWSKRFSRLPATLSSKDFEESIGLQVSARMHKLYDNWQTCLPEPLEQFICEHWLALERTALVVAWSPSEKRIKANPSCLPAVLAWACVFHAKHLRICRNSEFCPQRYFLGSRRDQRYCSEECAVPAKRAAKLRWWHKHGGTKNPGNQT